MTGRLKRGEVPVPAQHKKGPRTGQFSALARFGAPGEIRLLGPPPPHPHVRTHTSHRAVDAVPPVGQLERYPCRLPREGPMFPSYSCSLRRTRRMTVTTCLPPGPPPPTASAIFPATVLPAFPTAAFDIFALPFPPDPPWGSRRGGRWGSRAAYWAGEGRGVGWGRGAFGLEKRGGGDNRASPPPSPPTRVSLPAGRGGCSGGSSQSVEEGSLPSF